MFWTPEFGFKWNQKSKNQSFQKESLDSGQKDLYSGFPSFFFVFFIPRKGVWIFGFPSQKSEKTKEKIWIFKSTFTDFSQTPMYCCPCSSPFTHNYIYTWFNHFHTPSPHPSLMISKTKIARSADGLEAAVDAMILGYFNLFIAVGWYKPLLVHCCWVVHLVINGVTWGPYKLAENNG